MPFPGRWWHEPTAKDAFRLTWVSLLFEVAAATGGIIGFIQTESSLILAFALENIVDLLSSSVVLWRFYAPSGSDDAQLAKLQAREERANVALSTIIGILGLFLIIVGIVDILETEKETELDLLFNISFFSFFFCFVMATIKLKYADALNSKSMHKDGICSLIGVALSAALVLTTSIIERYPGWWYFDPVASLILGVAATIYGFKKIGSMIKNGIPIFSKAWWNTSGDSGEVRQGSGNDDFDSVNNELPETRIGSNNVADQKDDEHEII